MRKLSVVHSEGKNIRIIGESLGDTGTQSVGQFHFLSQFILNTPSEGYGFVMSSQERCMQELCLSIYNEGGWRVLSTLRCWGETPQLHFAD